MMTGDRLSDEDDIWNYETISRKVKGKKTKTDIVNRASKYLDATVPDFETFLIDSDQEEIPKPQRCQKGKMVAIKSGFEEREEEKIGPKRSTKTKASPKPKSPTKNPNKVKKQKAATSSSSQSSSQEQGSSKPSVLEFFSPKKKASRKRKSSESLEIIICSSDSEVESSTKTQSSKSSEAIGESLEQKVERQTVHPTQDVKTTPEVGQSGESNICNSLRDIEEKNEICRKGDQVVTTDAQLETKIVDVVIFGDDDTEIEGQDLALADMISDKQSELENGSAVEPKVDTENNQVPVSPSSNTDLCDNHIDEKENPSSDTDLFDDQINEKTDPFEPTSHYHFSGGFLTEDDPPCADDDKTVNPVKTVVKDEDVKQTKDKEKLATKFDDSERKIHHQCDSVLSSKFPQGSVMRKQTSLFSFFKSKAPQSSLSNTNNDIRLKNAKILQGASSGSSASKVKTKSFTTKDSDNSTFTASNEENQNIRGGNRRNKVCPFYKKIPGTPITVDAFRYGIIQGCEAYVLTHFHYDHYGGLTKKFAQPIYCSEVTANLVEKRLGVHTKWVNRLPMWKPCVVADVTLTLMEANHCPGAVIILFETKDGRRILHTGDFRASKEMEDYSPLRDRQFISSLYLDTTYCNPSYAFPPQKDVIDYVVNLVQKHMTLHPKTLIVCGSYTIGKERIFLAIAKALDSKICVMSDKKKVLDCLQDKELKDRVTLDWSQGKVHVLPMGKLNQQALHDHHMRHSRFTSILAFQPTGWTHSSQSLSLDNLRPKWSSYSITLYGVPYSEHSSFLELKRFVQFTKAGKILPTVNNGNPDARKKMEDLFQQWLNEAPR